MSKNIESVLQQVAEDTFASMVFFLPAEAPAGAPDASGPLREAAVDFTGPFAGRLTLSVPDAMAGLLAANMLGLEGGRPTPLQERDALAELANVICGNLLPIVATPQDVFSVGHPSVTPPDPQPEAPREPPAAAATLFFEEGSVRLAFHAASLPATPRAADLAGAGGRP
jgi:hypothetical protein